MKKVLKLIGLLILTTFVVMQFFRIDKSTPEYEKSDDLITQTNPSEKIETILRTSCYDCHSFETKYPWYSNVAPISWWLADHIEEGREHLNFSIWASYSDKKKHHKLEEVWEEVEKGKMPLEDYLYTHSDAELSNEDKEALIRWFKDIANPPKPATTEVVLNNGEKWNANIETAQGMANMSDLINADFDHDNLEKHHEMAKNLNQEIRSIFSNCTMKGEAHEQLHNYILPLVKLCNQYEKTETISEAEEIHSLIQHKISEYTQFFKTDA